MRAVLLAALLLLSLRSCFERQGDITLLSESEPLIVKVHGGTESVMLPENGLPPPLLDGYVYTVSAVTDRGPRPKTLCIYVNKGRLQPYKNYNDPPCDQD